jgi:peptide/nickel transport system permease protein
VLADRARHMVLPVLVLALVYTASWMRTVRASVLEVMPQPMVRTARAKGASRTRALMHALRNALLPFVTVVALSVPAVFSGALLTETVFAWPGVGRLQYEAILNNDSYVAIVVLLVSSALVLLGSLAADILYALLDPRMRTRRDRS